MILFQFNIKTFNTKIKTLVASLILVELFWKCEGVGFNLKQFVEGEWCYLDPLCAPPTWKGMCTTGSNQSPIDLRLYDSQISITPVFLNYYRYQDTVKFANFLIQNNGHTIEAEYESESDAPVLLGPYLDSSYIFAQLHFHWGSNDNQGSEHQIYGKSYAAELHMVHYSSKYPNLSTAVASTGDPAAVAVLAIFLQPSFFDNQALAPIIDSIGLVNPYVTDIPEVPSQRRFNPVKLLPWKSNFYRYLGSFTTPNCGEKVIWTVFEQPIKISKRQLNVLRNVRNQEGQALVDNFRPIQPTNGRKVTYYQVTYHLYDLIVGLCRQFISLIRNNTPVSFMSFVDKFQRIIGYTRKINLSKFGLISFSRRRNDYFSN